MKNGITADLDACYFYMPASALVAAILCAKSSFVMFAWPLFDRFVAADLDNAGFFTIFVRGHFACLKTVG